jgi:CRP-like cAMP-binding protein
MAAPRTNQLLDALSPESRNRIISLSKEVTLPLRTSLQEQELKPSFGYFLLSGIASVVINLPEGGTAEVAVIGREGLTGCLSLLGPSTPPSECFVQLAATAYKIPFDALQKLFLESEEIRTRILEVTQQQTLTMSQIAACNKLHDNEARLSRWLLMIQDRTEDDVLQLTQEFLAEMLGARRTTVAISAGTLQRAGLIEYKRGRVKIVSRENLEAAACDCYQIAKRFHHSLYKQNS